MRFLSCLLLRAVVLAAMVLALPLPTWAQTSRIDGLTPDGRLDKDRINELYFDAEFDKLSLALESYRTHASDPTHEDSIYVFKYLSVVYAAYPETKAKAEFYMYTLLRMIPTIELIDLYVSDQVILLFNQVRNRLEKERKYAQNYDELGRPLHPDATHGKDSEPRGASARGGGKSSPSNRSSKAWVPWAVGGAATVGAVTAFVLLTRAEPSAGKDTLEIQLGRGSGAGL